MCSGGALGNRAASSVVSLLASVGSIVGRVFSLLVAVGRVVGRVFLVLVAMGRVVGRVIFSLAGVLLRVEWSLY